MATLVYRTMLSQSESYCDEAVSCTSDNGRGMFVTVGTAAMMVDPLPLLMQLQNELIH